jgi:Thrombospondin type 1 domain
VTCGGGTKYKFPVCHQVGEGVVSDEDCVASAGNKKPEKIIQLCNEDPCPAFWWIGPWQLCQATCQKVGETTPIRKRSIMCVDQNQQALPDERCDADSRPVDAEFCPGKLPFCSLDADDDDKEKDAPDDDNEENNTI